jgi:PAS domain S-box-containing protein
MSSVNILQIKARREATEWLFLIMAAVVIALFFIFTYVRDTEHIEETEGDHLHNLTNVIATDITVNLITIDGALNGIIADYFSAFPLQQDRLPEASLRLRALELAMPGVRALTVLNAQGIVIAAFRPELIGSSFAGRDYFRTSRADPDKSRLYISAPFISLQKDLAITASKIISNPDGSFGGLAVATLDPKYFMGMFKAAIYTPDVWGVIIHGNGRQLLNYPVKKIANGADLNHPGTFFTRHLESRQSATLLKGIVYTTGENRLMALSTIKPEFLNMDTGIIIGLSRDLAAIAEPARRQLILYGIFYTLLMLLCAAWLYRTQIKRKHIDSLRATLDQHRSESRFKTLIEDAPLAIAMLRGGHFIYANPRYRALHGYSAQADLHGLSWYAMMAPASAVAVKQIEELIATDSPIEQKFEAQIISKDESLIPVFKTSTRVLLADGPATIIFSQDISAQKRAEFDMLKARDLAEAANRSKAEFLANMSHEVRSPLNAILGLVHILEQTRLNPDSHDMVMKIKTSGRTLLGIVNDILDVSKIEAGQMMIEQAPFRLSNVIDNLAYAMGLAAADRNIELIIHPLPAGINNVLGDALRLEQILLNLTSNAIKFTPAGHVELGIDLVSRSKDKIVLQFSVRDTGIGISPELQNAVFSPFTQADSSTTRRFGGTGLGLAICRQLVNLMGGEIGMKSIPGEGSEFYFTLSVGCTDKVDYSSPDMIRIDALIADDNQIALGALHSIVQGLGWQANMVDSGEAAMTHLHARAPGALPDVIILDWKMPGIDGLETARLIRQHAGEGDAPIVIMATAFSLSSLASQPGVELVDAILNKPVTASNLYNAVIQALQRRSANPPDCEAASETSGQCLAGIRLFIVDDSEINREVAKRIFEDQGAIAVTADNGREAVDWLLAHPDDVDLILMDVQMPVMDGIEAARELRKFPQFDAIPIVALTAGAFKSQQDAALAAGMSHFVSKPFDVPSTIALIQRISRPSPAAAQHMKQSEMGTNNSTNIAAVAQDAPAILSPEAPAIDIVRGRQLWLDVRSYKDYLQLFMQSHSDTVAQINACLIEDDRSGAAALAHKLSGVAGNLALPGTQRLAAEAERVLTLGYDPSAILAHLQQELLRAVAAIEQFSSANEEHGTSATPAGDLSAEALHALKSKLKNTLQLLLHALDSDNPTPAEILIEALRELVPDRHLTPVRACVRHFDFRGAKTATVNLATQHDLVLDA